jgi:tetratricopeptide (TPR) repeat protein
MRPDLPMRATRKRSSASWVVPGRRIAGDTLSRTIRLSEATLNTIPHRPMTLPAVAARATILRIWLAVVLGAVLTTASAQATTPTETSDLVRYGTLYFGQGDCALAQYFFQEALKRDERNVEALVGKGRSLTCQKAYNASVESLRQALEVDPGHIPAYVHLALTYQEQHAFDPTSYPGRLGEALEVLQRAEARAPNDATVQNTKGIVLYQSGNLDQARTTLERAVQLAGGSGLSERERSTVHVNLGRTYRDLGQLELAQQAFRRAVVLDPASATAHNNLGNVMFRLGDCAGAEFELSQAVSLAPGSLSAISSLAIALFECGEVAESVPHFEQALQLDGAVFAPPLFTYLARAYLELGRLEEAVRRAQQGALLPPESAEAHYHLGRTYAARRAEGDLAAARRAFERALELDAGYGPAREALTALR